MPATLLTETPEFAKRCSLVPDGQYLDMVHMLPWRKSKRFSVIRLQQDTGTCSPLATVKRTIPDHLQHGDK